MEDVEMSDANKLAWELSQSFTSDGQGIRCVCFVPPKEGTGDDSVIDSYRIITGNQGGGLCEFGVPSGNLNVIPYQHNHAITALLAHEQFYITGCKDSIVRIFDSNTHSLVGQLEGHEKPVTSLSWAEAGNFLISGSWDGTAKIWDFNRRCLIATLPDHENSVCVTGLRSTLFDDDTNNMLYVATGSAGMASNNVIKDHTVRIWSISKATGQTKLLQSTANDHDGPIRDICLSPPDQTTIATCSNDGTVRTRLMGTGESISVLAFVQQHQQHPPMLLSLAGVNNHQGLVASSDDGQVVVWTNLQEQPQIIPHAQCVWNVSSLPNNDFATCCQDGTLRIFSLDQSRWAPKEDREQFAKSVAEAVAKTSSGPSNEEIAKLPRWEHNNNVTGKSEGQVHLFQKDGVAIAAQWSAASGTWIEVGQVMGSKDSGMVDGQKYDHVLPIEIEQTGGSVSNLQIGYNNGENTFVAAQRFIDAHVLPQHHLAQIADYIQQRVGNQTPTLGMGAPSAAGPGGAGGAPFAAAATTGVPIASFEYLPMKVYKSFELSEKAAKTTFEKMKTKLQSFGKLSDDQLNHVSSLMETLSATNRYHSTKIDDVGIKLIQDMLDLFSTTPDQVFPAIDLARLTIVHPDAISSTARCNQYWDKIIQKVIHISNESKANDNLQGPAKVAIPMLSIRLYTNALRSGSGSRDIIIQNLDNVLVQVSSCVQSTNKNIRLSVATFLYNLAFYIYNNNGNINNSDDISCNIVTMIDAAIGTKSYESEALMRLFIALGTIAIANNKAKDMAKTLFLGGKVQPAASPHGDPVKRAAKEVYCILA